MWFEKIAGLVIGQIALSVLLTVALWLLWSRLRREQHLAFWSWSWAAAVVYITSLALYALIHQIGGRLVGPLTAIAVAGATLGWLQPAFLMLAAGSLRSGAVPRRHVALATGAALACGVVWTLTAWLHVGWTFPAEPFRRLQMVVAPRTFAEAIGVACYALFFHRYYARGKGLSGWLTVGFSLVYAAHLTLVALGDIGIYLYGDPNGILNSAMAIVVPLGITLGIGISVLEQAEHSESAIRSVWNSSVGMRLTDAEGRIIDVNPAFCEFVGRTRGELVGHMFSECYDPTHARALEEWYRHEFASRALEPRARRSFRLWDGRSVEAEVTNAFVNSPAGPQLLSLIQDTTREHEATEALRETDERLQLLLDSLTDAVFDFRADGSAVERYTRFHEMLGYRRGEITETLETWLSLMHPEDRSVVAGNPLAWLEQSSTADQREYRLRRKDGRWAWIRSSARVIERDRDGRPLRVIGTMTDITSRKNAQEQARRLEMELVERGKMEAIGRLAGGVAHDFNNYLTVINGYSDLMLNQTSDEALRERLRKIRSAGEKAADLTQQLLTVSRKHRGGHQPVRLNSAVSEFHALVQHIIGENVEIVTSIDPDLGWVQADPGHVHQVLMNLTLNARDAMPAGGQITIETARLAAGDPAGHRPHTVQPGAYARLSVIDQGLGMTPEIAKHIFEPFFTTKAPGTGTGLGLATVYSIAHLAGGWVDVETVPGAGSSFHVYLPMLESVVEPVNPEPAGAEAPVGTETILVVEDRDDLRHVAIDILEEQGYRVLEACGAEEAISLSAAYPGAIHLLFTDAILPGIGGPELARNISRTRRDIRVLFTSGQALPEGLPLLARPFSPVELCDTVRDILDSPQDLHALGTIGLS